MHPIHLVGLYTTRLPVFRWKARGYDWILVDSIGQPSLLPTTSVGNEQGQQMRIQILILVFKGLSGFDYCDTVEPPLSSLPSGYQKVANKWGLATQ